jgi:hypothetical protein
MLSAASARTVAADTRKSVTLILLSGTAVLAPSALLVLDRSFGFLDETRVLTASPSSTTSLPPAFLPPMTAVCLWSVAVFSARRSFFTTFAFLSAMCVCVCACVFEFACLICEFVCMGARM